MELDRTFMLTVVGNGSSGITGPFEKAIGTFWKGRSISLVAAALGKTNKEFGDILKFCADMAVAQGGAIFNSPVFETNVKGGAISVTLWVYHCAMAVTLAHC